jgi:hypothetical protein
MSRSDSPSNQPFFKIVSFRPFGVREPIYPNKYCSLCRGLLAEKCAECFTTDASEEYCLVEKTSTHDHVHTHCNALANSNLTNQN